MSLSSWLWGATQIDDAVDKATSELLPSGSEDIALNLEICDQIRSKAASPKDAMHALKRRLSHKNPNVQLLALGLTDVCIKNGGDHLLVEIASREFMDNLVSILKMPSLNLDVKNKILRLVQNWAFAFEGKPNFSYVGQVYKSLKDEGYSFPPRDPVVANAAMVDTQTAPEWIDSDVCLRCRTPFSFTNRKHHCRNCGQVFDQQCSAKVLPLSHFGITQEVRVCDGCYVKLTRNRKKSHSADNHLHHRSPSQHRPARNDADADLQRAIQLSLQETGSSASGSRRPGYIPYQPKSTLSSSSPYSSSEPPLVDRNGAVKSSDVDDETDAELKAAIEASLREANGPKASAPIVADATRPELASFSDPQPSQPYASAVPALPTYDLQSLESDAILTFNQAVEHVESSGGWDLSRYPGVNDLYEKANGLRPKLAMSLDDTDRKQKLLSEMHEKLSQAVKLYDNLLSEQVSRPAWRPSHQTQSSGYAIPTRYNTVDGSHTRWASVSGPSMSTFQHPTSPVPPTQQKYGSIPQVNYGQTQQSPQYASSVSESSSQLPRVQQSAQQYVVPQPSTPMQWPQPQPSLQQTVPYAPSLAPQQQQQPQLSPVPPPVSYNPSHIAAMPIHQHSSPPPANVAVLYNPNSSQIVRQEQQPSASLSSPVPQGLPSMPSSSPSQQANQARPPDMNTQYQYTTYLQQPTQPLVADSISTLSRHDIHVSPTTNSFSLSQTVNSPIAAFHYPQPQPQVQPHAVPALASFPNFPVAPTSDPQPFALYGPEVPSSVEQTERKEALLIEL